ncbi:MAG: hypothetical protein IJ998_08205 [Alistipes sp.]|nr:hypothetical protein [Alistipes sp.]
MTNQSKYFSARLSAAAIALVAVVLSAFAVGCSPRGVVDKAAEPQEELSDSLMVSGYFLQDSILIGDRFDYVVEVQKDMAEFIEFPEYGSRDLELVAEHIDTLKMGARRQKVRKQYTFVAFGLGDLKLLPQVLYGDKNILDTIYAADSVSLHIANPFKIDTTSRINATLKPQADMPFIFAEIEEYFWWGVVAVMVIALLVGATILILHHYGMRLGDLFRPAPVLPPHIVAKQELERLYLQRLWQAERHKQYYSSLTDILRQYILARYGVGAMEMTTEEILSSLRRCEVEQALVMTLGEVLRDADLVKFAKAMPEAERNEQAYSIVWDFVEQTTPVEVEAEEEPQPRRRKKRKR